MSTVSKIIEYLETQNIERTYINSDFTAFGDDASIRSALVRLCEKNTLIRLCQGVYMKASSQGITPPDSLLIASEIARRNGAKIQMKEDSCINNVRIISFYTDSSTRSIVLNNGTILKFIHSNIVK